MSCGISITVPDATAVVKDSGGTILATDTIPSGTSKDIIVNTVTNLVLHTYPYDSFNTGQDVSYAVGDDKDIRDTVFAPEIASWDPSLIVSFPRLSQTDLTKLAWGSNPDGSGTNIFGNLERYTDTLGTQLYDNDLIIDHLTGLMIKRSLATANNNGLAAISISDNLIYENYSDYFCPNARQLFSILFPNSGASLNYFPFNALFPDALWASTRPLNINGYNFSFANNYSITISANTRPGLSISFRKAFAYNPTTKQMELT